jgi:hypothetical protein
MAHDVGDGEADGATVGVGDGDDVQAPTINDAVAAATAMAATPTTAIPIRP